MSSHAHLPYRPGVGMILLNEANKVFVARRIDTKAEAWQMPQGGVDPGEEIEAAALRELKEEIGTDQAQLIARAAAPYRYDLPDHLVPQLWGGKFRGQEQHWLAYRFTGTDHDIDLNTEHPEFCAWQWVEMAELPHLIVPFKRELYAALVAEFSALLSR